MVMDQKANDAYTKQCDEIENKAMDKLKAEICLHCPNDRMKLLKILLHVKKWNKAMAKLQWRLNWSVRSLCNLVLLRCAYKVPSYTLNYKSYKTLAHYQF